MQIIINIKFFMVAQTFLQIDSLHYFTNSAAIMDISEIKNYLKLINCIKLLLIFKYLGLGAVARRSK